MCGKPANSTGWRDVGFIHTALLEGMIALSGKSIYYIIGDFLTDKYSEEIEFFVPAARGVQLSHRCSGDCYYCDEIFPRCSYIVLYYIVVSC